MFIVFLYVFLSFLFTFLCLCLSTFLFFFQITWPYFCFVFSFPPLSEFLPCFLSVLIVLSFFSCLPLFPFCSRFLTFCHYFCLPFFILLFLCFRLPPSLVPFLPSSTLLYISQKFIIARFATFE